ncbi:MAG: uroporphyrinogen-III synthase [Saprospiraceae bacterium]|nr:uroporphyrinogen-III synthase [Pyrinomonadaceae bacterium]
MNKFEGNKTYGVFGNTEGRIIEARIEDAGAAVITFPFRACEKIALEDSGRDCLRNLDSFDWIIFNDIYSALYFVEALADMKIDVADLDALRICSAGENVMHYLRAFQIHSDLILAPNGHAAGEIAQFAGFELNGLCFLIPTDSAAENMAAAELKCRGADIHELPLYRTKPVGENDSARVKALMLGGAIDELVFSNLDDLLSLQFLFPDHGLCELLKDVDVIAASDDVYQTLTESGLNPRHI